MAESISRRPRRNAKQAATGPAPSLSKAPSGIEGLDAITRGGLPRGRPTLVCGGAGAGKTLFAMEFLVRGATQYGEPGVFMAFEETAEELAMNVASLGFDLQKLEAENKIVVDFVRVERSEIEETGEYDLEGLFIRLQLAIDSIGAKRVVLDTLESLFGGFSTASVLRAELRRLFRWLKDRGMTVVVTGERGDGALTRQGLEEYVADCVIFLDHRVAEQTSTRRLRIVKYRGTAHETSEYPFVIDATGISILPVTSLGLDHVALHERVSTGIPRLDEMIGGKGPFKGSTVLLSGTAGTGKTCIAALMALAACKRGERCMLFAFEESASQILRNAHSIGVDLEPFIKNGLFAIRPARPTSHGLELHLASMHRAIVEFSPDVVIIDPITNLTAVGTPRETQEMVIRLIDFLKMRGTTSVFTSLTTAGDDAEKTAIDISSLIDTWLMLQIVHSGGERNRILTVIKSRGMAHSNQTSEYKLTNDGLQIIDPYLGATEVLTGSARIAREADDASTATARGDELVRRVKERDRRKQSVERQIIELREQFEADDAVLSREISVSQLRREQQVSDRADMGRSRHVFQDPGNGARPRKERRA